MFFFSQCFKALLINSEFNQIAIDNWEGILQKWKTPFSRKFSWNLEPVWSFWLVLKFVVLCIIWAVSLGPVYWKVLFTTVQFSPRSLKLQGKSLADQHWRNVFYHKKNEKYVKMKVKLKNQQMRFLNPVGCFVALC